MNSAARAVQQAWESFVERRYAERIEKIEQAVLYGHGSLPELPAAVTTRRRVGELDW